VSDGLVAPLGAQTCRSVKPQRPRWVASGGRDETQAPACMREYLTTTIAKNDNEGAEAYFRWRLMRRGRYAELQWAKHPSPTEQVSTFRRQAIP
jgi:hypothetical protein